MKNRISTFIAIITFVSTFLFINYSFTEQHVEHNTRSENKAAVLNVKLHTEPKEIQAGKSTTLMFHLTDRNGEPFTDLMIHHDRILHALIVSENLQIVGHIHPEDFETRNLMEELDGVFTIHFTFPEAGRYILALDVMTTDAEYSKHLFVDVTGDKKMSEMTEEFLKEKLVFGYTEEGGDRYTKAVSITDDKGTSKYHVKIDVPEKIKPNEMVHITYNISQNGVPVTDLVPFLDAPMHFAIVSTRLDGILHTHGTVPMKTGDSKMKKSDTHDGHKMEKKPAGIKHQHQGSTPEKFGPTVMLMTTFPKAGAYQIFGQLKHKDQILFPTFMVRVEE